MQSTELQVVTGAFGYTGRHIARRLLDQGMRVKTLTGHPDRPSPFGDRVSVGSLDFNDPDGLFRDLDGADTLYDTYWIRFARGDVTFERAVENSAVLIRAAERAGVRRIVYISITNASAASPLPYFRGKGLVEEAVRASGLGFAIIRPTVLFGNGDILLNNVAWALRRFPVFPISGSGKYRIQPVFVGDVARIAVAAGGATTDQTIDTVGPDIFSFEELVRLVARCVGARVRLTHAPPKLMRALTMFVGLLVKDVVLTGDEIDGLMAGLLVSQSLPTGEVRLEDWLIENVGMVGRRYASELDRHYR